ncbi:cation:dicarboxylate symporter family transporter [Bremerella alba]|uniref:C4-dicarboxylate transport protein n=1 Tax=Bremerella alba TaxID=980252 RepID=A0A7V8V8Q4_9BACT|nr:cation:dicarboxylase symporter family transporter [Bremerella alba]MBA2116754.1 C4-dicarboxylate transport protein [Bremerella alba]
MANSTDRKGHLNFSTWVLIALVLGIGCGLFLGEYVTSIKWVSDVYVGLLQMAVLPYVLVSLVANIGQLTRESGMRMLRVSLLVLLLLWVIGIVALAISTLAFPKWDTGSFYSSRFTDSPPAYDWKSLFIPSNPFESLATNSVPAVVVFAIGLGIALMYLPNKEKLLEPLQVLIEALAKVNKMVVQMTPIGLFAIAAYTAGTIDLAQLSLLQGYLLAYCLPAVIISLVVLPSLVAAVTPLGYWDVLRASRDALITAFVIGNSFVVLPMIIDGVKRLQKESGLDGNLNGDKPEYLVPLAYPMPDIGRILALVFIPFAAWFSGTVIAVEDYPPLLGVGFLGAFGKPVVTVPLMLSIAELPSDLINLYLISGVVAARFGDLMKTMHLISFTLLTFCVLGGSIRFKLTKLVVGLTSSLVLLLAVSLGTRIYLISEFQDHYSREDLLTERTMLPIHGDSSFQEVGHKVLETSQPNPQPIRSGESRVQRIQNSGVLRVGFNSDRMPFAYFNGQQQLIGFDIQMAYILASDLGVNIEFVPIDRDNFLQQMQEDHFDVAMSAIEGSVSKAIAFPASEPYMDVTMALVVPDRDEQKFRDIEKIMKLPKLKLAAIKNSFFAELARKDFPKNIQIVELDTAEQFFEGQHQKVDGLVISAESGSAWTLRYPHFAVTNPLHGRDRVPLYYLSYKDPDFDEVIENWLRLKRADGTYQLLYDYWILGEEKRRKPPRWSVLRNVLGWAD